MSEYTYACPVCGQHMRCDSSQAGTVMECPTCFQQITAPQAPAAGDDQKFVLTGTKVGGERPLPKVVESSGMAPAAKGFPWAIVVVVLVLGLVGAGAFVFRDKLFNSSGSKPPTAGDPPAKAQKAEKPPAIAPPASDANWMLSLGTNAIPDSPVAGRIHGQDFVVERATFQNGSLMLRHGLHGPVEFAAFINFSGAPPEALSGQTINVMTNAEKAARVSLRWKDAAGTVQKVNYNDSYALRLEFGALANNRLPGKIYLCAPDEEKSYLLGSFNADARKPKPKAPKN